MMDSYFTINLSNSLGSDTNIRCTTKSFFNSISKDLIELIFKVGHLEYVLSYGEAIILLSNNALNKGSTVYFG